MKLVVAKCPSCGANIKVDSKKEEIVCQYCNCQVMVEDAIQKYKIEVSGQIEVSNLPKLENYLKLGDRAYEDGEYQEAFDHYSKSVELDPDCCHAILRRGFCKCLCCSYEDLEIDYALKSMKTVYKVLFTDHYKKDSPLLSYILDCIAGISKIEWFLFHFSQENLFDSRGIREYYQRLWQCLRFYQYLYSILPEDWMTQVRLLNSMIACIDTLLQKRKYWSGEFLSNGRKLMSQYRLDSTEKKVLIHLKEEYRMKRGELDPSYLIEENQKEEVKKRNIAFIFRCLLPFLFGVLAFGCFMTHLFLCGFLWLLVMLLFFSKTRSMVISQNKKLERPFFILKIILLIVTIFVFAYFSPFEFEKKWVSEDGWIVEFKRNRVRIEREDRKVIEGTYSHSGGNSDYLLDAQVRLSDSNVEHFTFRYKKRARKITFCLLENEKCKIYFTPEQKDSSYIYLTK